MIFGFGHGRHSLPDGPDSVATGFDRVGTEGDAG
jgi:hypothetical protein